MDHSRTQKLKDLLESSYESWPIDYTFKFIVQDAHIEKACNVLKKGELSYRPSRTGKYTSITSIVKVYSSDEVIDIYTQMAQIEGVISL